MTLGSAYGKGKGKVYGKCKGKGKAYGKGKGKCRSYGKGHKRFLELKEKKKRKYVFTNITFKSFLKNNNKDIRISKESFQKIEDKTKEFVMNLVEESEQFMIGREGKTLSANDVINALEEE